MQAYGCVNRMPFGMKFMISWMLLDILIQHRHTPMVTVYTMWVNSLMLKKFRLPMIPNTSQGSSMVGG